MEPSCCDPHARAGLTHLAHPHRARVRPAEPLDAPGACPALTPRAVASIGVQRRPAGSRAGLGAGLGRGRTRPPEPPPAAPIPVRPAPRDEGITPPSPACPSPALPLLPSQQPCCDMPCHAVPIHPSLPLHRSVLPQPPPHPSPAPQHSPKPRQQAAILRVWEGAAPGGGTLPDHGALASTARCQGLTCRERAKQRGQGRW